MKTPEYVDIDMVVTVRVPVTFGKRGCPDSSLLNWGASLLRQGDPGRIRSRPVITGGWPLPHRKQRT